jgi:hypothetical protein
VKVLLRGCQTRVAVSGIQDGSDPTGISQTPIAKLLARQLGRTVQGFYAGLYFSLKDAPIMQPEVTTRASQKHFH